MFTKSSYREYFILLLKGIAMGAADVVPGVSGGTVAFVAGIYDELLDSIRSINHKTVKTLFSKGPGVFLQQINAPFLITLFSGVFLSIFSLAKVIQNLLDTSPILLWSFFFGLIIASVSIVGKKIEKWDLFTFGSLIIGTILAFLITTATPATTPEGYWFVLVSGVIAICAMILPGISGSFILVLLGKYQFILSAVTGFKIDFLLVFAAGCGSGLLLFSNVLSWLLKHYRDITTALLTGFMIGSLAKVWPWKITTEWFNDRHGIAQPLIQKNVLPDTFSKLTEQSSQVIPAILLAVAGILIVVIFEIVSSKKEKKQSIECGACHP